MWKPTNQPQTPARPAEPERPTTSTPSAPVMASEPPAAPRPVTTTTADQATIGKSLVIKGEVTGSESLYIDGRVEGSINLSGNRVTVGRNGVVAANINAREIVVLGNFPFFSGAAPVPPAAAGLAMNQFPLLSCQSSFTPHPCLTGNWVPGTGN